MSVIQYYLINPNEPDALDLLMHLCSDFNQDPYPENTLYGDGVYYRPDAIVEDITVGVVSMPWPDLGHGEHSQP